MTNGETATEIDLQHVPDAVIDVARAIRDRGGRALLVGGFVRDALLGETPLDIDLEVHGLSQLQLDSALASFGRVHVVGRAFEIRLVRGFAADISWVPPDADAGDHSEASFESTYARVSTRRDLTINSMGFDPLTRTLFDPHGGRRDLGAGRLHATDESRFGDDPARALRVAQLAARLEMTPDAPLLSLCAQQDLTTVAGERLGLEWNRMLTRAARPSLGLAWLEAMDQLKAFAPIDALRRVPQDPRWHPEGDVYVHTCQVIDVAATLCAQHEDPLALMYGALCHDFGKPETTETDGDRIRAHGHAKRGAPIARRFLEDLHAPRRLTDQVGALVEHHLAPAEFTHQGAGDRAYRRLVRKLDEANVTAKLLVEVARADHLGRTTDDAREGRFEAGDAFLARIDRLALDAGAPTPVVLGRHLLARGFEPGPQFSEILARCLAVQDESDERSPDVILQRVLDAEDGTPQSGDDS